MVERAVSRTVQAAPECGVEIWAPRKFRDIKGFNTAPVLFDEHGAPHGPDEREIMEMVQGVLEHDLNQSHKNGVQHLILQEENILGSMRSNLHAGRFYPLSAQRLAGFAKLLPMQPDTIALAVREYGAVWNSAFGYLRGQGKDIPPPQQAVGEICDRARGWVDLVREIRRVWPKSDVLMWQQEHLRYQGARICGVLTGLPAEAIQLPPRKVNTTASKGDEVELFTQRQRVILRNRYRRNIARLHTEEFAPTVRWAFSKQAAAS